MFQIPGFGLSAARRPKFQLGGEHRSAGFAHTFVALTIDLGRRGQSFLESVRVEGTCAELCSRAAAAMQGIRSHVAPHFTFSTPPDLCNSSRTGGPQRSNDMQMWVGLDDHGS